METVDLLAGTLRSRYRLQKELGRGGMGRVFEAVQLNLGRRVAVKVLHSRLFEDAESRGRFVLEARLLGRLSHPNLVLLFEAELDGDCPCIVMELVEGPTLASVVREARRLPPAEALKLALPVLGALEYLHSEGVVHRDVKPENVLLAGGDHPKLADLGMARLEGHERLTAKGFMVGTPMFMPPEQMMARAVGPTADLYAFGVLLYNLVTGGYPISFGDPTGMLLAKSKLDPEFLTRRLPGDARWLAGPLASCLAAKPDARVQTAGELRRELLGSQPARVSRGAVPRARTTAVLEPARWRGHVVAAAVGSLALFMAVLAVVLGDPFGWRRASAAAAHAPERFRQEARPGASVVSWVSKRPYVSSVRVGSRVCRSGTTTAEHEVTVDRVPWGAPPEAVLLFPDGSTSKPFRLRSEPMTVRPAVRRGPRAARVEMQLPEPSALTVALADGERTVLRRESARAERHQLELPLRDDGRDYQLRVETPGEGLLASQMPEVVVTSPRRVFSQVLDDLRALELSDMVRVLNVDTARQLPPPHLAGLVHEKLERAWFRRLGLLEELAPGILGPGFEDREFLKLCLRDLEGLCVLEQCCNIHGIPVATGIRRILGERWRSYAGPAPAGGRSIEAAFPEPVVITGGIVWEIFEVGMNQRARKEHLVTVPALPAGRARLAYVTVTLKQGRCDGELSVVLLGPGGRDILGMRLLYPERKSTPEPVQLTHAFDPGLLQPGPNRFVIRFVAIPGGAVGATTVTGLRLTLED